MFQYNHLSKPSLYLRNYCEYNGEVFLMEENIGSIDQLTTIDIMRNEEIIYLTNGKTVFNLHNGIRIDIPDMDKWIQLTAGANINVVDNCAYFPASQEHTIVRDKILFAAAADSFILVDTYIRKEPQKIEKAFIKHAGNYEPLNIQEYKLYNGFYAYKGTIPYGDRVILNNFDMSKLKVLKGYGRQGWLSDGKLLTHMDMLKTKSENPSEAEFTCVHVADIQNLKVVYEKLLVDSVNFYELRYERGNSVIEVIPIESIGFDVKIELSLSAY